MNEAAPLLRQPGPEDIDVQLRATVARKIAENHAGIPVAYSLSAILAQAPGAPAGVLAAAYLLILSMKSPLLTPPRICAPQLINDGCPSDSQIEAAVRDCLDALYEGRRRLLNPGPGDGFHPGAN